VFRGDAVGARRGNGRPPGSASATLLKYANQAELRQLAAHRNEEHQHDAREEQTHGQPDGGHRRAKTGERVPSVTPQWPGRSGTSPLPRNRICSPPEHAVT